MIRMCQIQHRITQQHHQLFMLSSELTSQRLITDLRDHTLSYPLPKLCLCCPKLFPIAANYQRGLLLPLLLLVRLSVHALLDTPRPLRVDPLAPCSRRTESGHTQKPRGEASHARQQLVVKTAHKTPQPYPHNFLLIRRLCYSRLKEVSVRSWVLSCRKEIRSETSMSQ